VPSNLKEGASCGGACNLIGNCAAGLECVVPDAPTGGLGMGMPLRGVAPGGMMQQQIGTCTAAAPDRECGGCEEVEGGADADHVSREPPIARVPMELRSPPWSAPALVWRVLW
jgi:hypothetical protein